MAKTPEVVPPKPRRYTSVSRKTEPRVCQGDIFRNIEYFERVIETDDKIKISSIIFPYVIILTQDCDLEQDHSDRTITSKTNHDKHLFSVLVAPLYNVEHLRGGAHLQELGMTMQLINSNKASFVKNNEISRYHYLEFNPQDVQLPPLAIDFKHYFSLNVEYLKERIPTHWVCKIAELHRENVCQRFASFLARIGLPNI
jgi:hypothetical protein